MDILYQNLLAFELNDLIMLGIGCLLIYLAIGKEMEPSLLLPMGFGTILVTIPFSHALAGHIRELYEAGIANKLFPLLLFIGIGAMIDFSCLHCSCQYAWLQICGSHYCCSVFLHGSGAHHPAAGHQAADQQKGAADPYAL